LAEMGFAVLANEGGKIGSRRHIGHARILAARRPGSMGAMR
jgi:hypothetical protein